MKYVLALDQGTTSSRAILFDKGGSIVASSQKEFPQHFPKPGWVEHNPEDIWKSQLAVAKAVLRKAKLTASDIVAIGITNQRETTVVWDRNTGKAIGNAIVWQDRRTAQICDALRKKKVDRTIQKKTGLILDAYFSGTKVQWILDNVKGARRKAEKGDLAFGTVDSWLIWRLTGGNVHVTDRSTPFISTCRTQMNFSAARAFTLSLPLATSPSKLRQSWHGTHRNVTNNGFPVRLASRNPAAISL